jgi:hypothetical protein
MDKADTARRHAKAEKSLLLRINKRKIMPTIPS